MHPALDKLASIQLSERWSHPEMLKIRSLGKEAVPPLRQVLREKDSPVTRTLLWVKGKWPGSTKYFSHFPDPQQLTERRWTACQVIQTLGPAGKAAAPELIKILQTGDVYDCNGASMALWAIGIDAAMYRTLTRRWRAAWPRHPVKSKSSLHWRPEKPPSIRTVQALTTALAIRPCTFNTGPRKHSAGWALRLRPRSRLEKAAVHFDQ